MLHTKNTHDNAIFPTVKFHLNGISGLSLKIAPQAHKKFFSSPPKPFQNQKSTSNYFKAISTPKNQLATTPKQIFRQDFTFQLRILIAIMKNSIQNTLQAAVERLKAKNIDSPRLDAEILLAHVLNCRRLSLYVDFDKILSLESVLRFNKLVNQRLNNFPVAYLTGKKDFMGLSFTVNKNVLIPRPDTEILTEFVGEYLRSLNKNTIFADLGTGSGAICISILKFVKSTRAIAVDISNDALEVAKFNANKFHVDDKIEFLFGNLFEPIKFKIFDAIVSNPPYIPTCELKTLQSEVKKEPLIALDGGEDGLNFYRRILNDAPKFLAQNGLLAVEIGINQAKSVKKLFEAANFADIEIFKDLAGIERVIAGRKIL